MANMVGSKCEITKRTKEGETTFTAAVTCADVRFDREGTPFIYFGYTPDDIRNGVFGYARYYGENVQKYGVVKVKQL